MTGSEALYDALAPHYDEHFAAPHRHAYDELAWQACRAALPGGSGVVVDVGCGVGRWAERLVALGHRVVGVEPAPAMAAAARTRLAGAAFTLQECRAAQAELPAGSADLVVAMGSLQYADDPWSDVRRAAAWLRPGGTLCLLVDGLVALAAELVRAGRDDEALTRLRTRRGVWESGGARAPLHLFDAAGLTALATGAGLVPQPVRGLLVGASVHGRDELVRRLRADPAGALAAEQRLSEVPELADLGKQLLLLAVRP